MTASVPSASEPTGPRVGLFGGTFDPIHLGHLVVAETVREVLRLDQVRLLVAGDPWMKDRESDASHRVAMTALAVADHDSLVVDDRETLRTGATYTADTLAHIHRDHSDAQLLFIVGADAAAHLPAWKHIRKAMQLATFVVVRRPGSMLPEHALMDQTIAVDTPFIDISSTRIRRDVAAGRSIRYRVPDAVIDHIQRHGLYRKSPT